MPLGIPITVSAYALVRGERVTVRRSWFERLFMGHCEDCHVTSPYMPWKPWVATKTVDGPMVPGAFQTPNGFIVHPDVFERLNQQLNVPFYAPPPSEGRPNLRWRRTYP